MHVRFVDIKILPVFGLIDVYEKITQYSCTACCCYDT